MAVATPVLERSKNQSEERSYLTSFMSEDELHNAQIKDNYRRLINPDFYLNEDRGGSAMRSEAIQAEVIPSVEAVRNVREDVRPEAPYLVRNARADADIFRADSAVNRIEQSAPVMYAENTDEDENEDLRPTQTTIQYRTVGETDKTTVKIRAEKQEHILGKREKIIIATFVSIVVALFALVIINSVIIANLNSDLSVIQSGLDTARGALAGVNADIAALTSPENIANFAQAHGLVIK